MIYTIIEPPFTLVFREMSRRELKEYNLWFHGNISERVRILAVALRSTPGYKQWEQDYSPHSLEALGEWFLAQAEMRALTPEEIENANARNKSKFSIATPAEELTERTFSLAIDIGMYVSQVFLKNVLSLRWSQPMGDRRFVDYGQPVLEGFRAGPFNPVRMMVTLAYGLAKRWHSGKRLLEIYRKFSDLSLDGGKEESDQENLL
jgi:hypothetical protein